MELGPQHQPHTADPSISSRPPFRSLPSPNRDRASTKMPSPSYPPHGTHTPPSSPPSPNSPPLAQQPASTLTSEESAFALADHILVSSSEHIVDTLEQENISPPGATLHLTFHLSIPNPQPLSGIVSYIRGEIFAEVGRGTMSRHRNSWIQVPRSGTRAASDAASELPGDESGTQAVEKRETSSNPAQSLNGEEE